MTASRFVVLITSSKASGCQNPQVTRTENVISMRPNQLRVGLRTELLDVRNNAVDRLVAQLSNYLYTTEFPPLTTVEGVNMPQQAECGYPFADVDVTGRPFALMSSLGIYMTHTMWYLMRHLYIIDESYSVRRRDSYFERASNTNQFSSRLKSNYCFSYI